VAAIVYQALVDANQVSAINSPYIVSAWASPWGAAGLFHARTLIKWMDFEATSIEVSLKQIFCGTGILPVLFHW
jgi:hypothetical protein